MILLVLLLIIVFLMGERWLGLRINSYINLENSEKLNMSRQSFTVCVLLVLLTTQQAYIHFQWYFSSDGTHRHESAILQEALGKERVLHQVTWNHLVRFRKYVSKLMPKVSRCLKGEGKRQKEREKRGLASLEEKDSSGFKLFEGQVFFRAKKYAEAAQAFKGFLDRGVAMELEVEARYLLAESYYLMGDFVKCLESVEALVALYPKNKLTGHALLRMANIHLSQGHREEAMGVYRTVLIQFPDPELATQARNAMEFVYQ